MILFSQFPRRAVGQLSAYVMNSESFGYYAEFIYIPACTGLSCSHGESWFVPATD